MLDKSLAYRLSIYISLAVVTVFIAFIVIYFLFNMKIIEENIDNKAISASAEVMTDIKKYVITTKELTQNVADQVIFYDQKDYVQPFIDHLLRKYPFINAFHINIDSSLNLRYHNYFSYRENDSTYFYQGNERFRNCVSEHTNYKMLIDGKKQNWSEPILCKRNNHVVVSYYTPIFSTVNNKTTEVGEIVCELSLLELNESINKIKIGKNGYSILMSKDGTYIAHPKKEWILQRNVKDLPPEVYKERKIKYDDFLSNNNSGSVIAYPEILNYEKSFVYYSRMEENGWILLLVIPYKELFEPLYVPILKMLFFSVLGILVIYILVTYISNKQIQPLSSLTSQLTKFTNISSNSYAGEESMNEIKQVADSLNLMKLGYEQYLLRISKEEKRNKAQQADLMQAAEIQKSLIKVDFPAFPKIPEIDLFASYNPAKIVSGDLFDYFFKDEEHLVLTMGDVSGKGVPAALFMSVAQTVIKTIASDLSIKRSSELVYRINSELHSNNMHQFFLTLFLGVLNIRTGKLVYCNAAHNSTYIIKASGTIDVVSDSHGLPLGLYRDKAYREGRYQLEKGDTIILYTDGVTELHDTNNLLYGHERLKENLRSLVGLEPQEMVTRIEKSLRQFAGDAEQSDDISILAFRYNG
ncbi:SpoIIE family protein phosphatase [Maribellus sp. YY47]|uniref:SpoIIE family protein phosphatase n=1 Tax=Maribellus sp. YY47 TaxID=2929486 RepID=UPI0020015855|nr:SpoIIE family protein phosphatase [Maribellus sp. YY47]MCK3686151.1 SpoIIE family protein phosphatase [Maribellus sp. YY47]